MDLEELKREIAYKVGKELRKTSRKLNWVWSIGDGHTYPTKKHAEIASEIHKKGYLFKDTILDNRIIGEYIDELREMGILTVEKDTDDCIYFSISDPPKNKKPVNLAKGVDMVENDYAKYKDNKKPIKGLGRYIDESDREPGDA